jgi:YHS domain-containing protein
LIAILVQTPESESQMTTRRTLLGYSIALPFAGLLAPLANAASPDVFNSSGVAIHGYDPVAYFNKGGAVDGSDAHALKWMGATWRFSSAENMAKFETDPHTFAPKYGGYCAYAMAQGAVATTVPEAWTIHEGKLYLNFSTGVRDLWRADIPGFVKAADGYWPAALNN